MNVKVGILYFISLAFLIVGCNDTPYMQGKRLYTANCQNCHMEDGSGLANLIPALSKSTKLGDARIACIIKNGIQDTIKNDPNHLSKEMPSFARLSATEVTNIVNYINHTWHQSFVEQTIIDIETTLKSCQ